MNYILYFVLILSTIVQSLSLGDKFGYIAYSLTSLITPIIFIIFLIINRKINISIYTKKLLKLMVYLIFVSLISLFIYAVILNNSNVYWGQNLLVKGLKASVYFLDIILFLIMIENIQKKLSTTEIFKPFVFTYFMLFFVLLFEIFDPLLFNSIFHGGEDYNRIRLLTPESSFTGTLIIVFSLATLYYYNNIKKNKLMNLVSMIILFIFVITNKSKGLYICLLISFLCIVLKNFKIKNMKNIIKLILSIVLLFSIYKLCSIYIFPMFQEDLQKYTSVVTRVYTTFCALKMSIIYPFGIGTTLYPVIYIKELTNNLYIFNNINMNLNLNEITSLINSTTGENVAAKVPIAQYAMYWGILGTIYFLWAYWLKIYRKAKENSDILLLGFIFIFISICTYTTFENKYEIWAFISLLYNPGIGWDYTKQFNTKNIK